MDYYAKYIKYKAKYLELKKRLSGKGNAKLDEECKNHTDCISRLYCSKALLTKGTCQPKKKSGPCREDEQCVNKCIKIGTLDQTKKCS
jgi:hypothetical protein